MTNQSEGLEEIASDYGSDTLTDNDMTQLIKDLQDWYNFYSAYNKEGKLVITTTSEQLSMEDSLSTLKTAVSDVYGDGMASTTAGDCKVDISAVLLFFLTNLLDYVTDIVPGTNDLQED